MLTTKMDDFDKEFLMEMFLETDTVSTLNRIAVAVSSVAADNSEIVEDCSTTLRQQMRKIQPDFLKRTRTVKHELVEYRFYESTILNYTDEQYEENFKMKRETIQKLIDYISKHFRPGGMRVPLEKKLHIFIWLLTSGSSYAEVGTLFGINKSSIAYILYEISSLLTELRSDFIKWPSIDQQHVTRIQVNNRTRFPNCVGFIDACRLKVGSKINKKEEPGSILLQAVCNESLLFTDIFVGRCGDTRKARVYKESPLSKELKNLVDFENHILGDSNYKLKRNLMTPFSSKELLTSEEMNYNEMHWKTRAYIGSAFDLLRTKFKKLNHIDLNKPDCVTTLVSAACVLHNFILLHEPYENQMKLESVLYEDGVTIDTTIVKNASEKRQFLCNYINYMENPPSS